MMVVMLITVAVFYVVKPEDLIAQHILIAVFILFFLNYLLRKFQILLSESSALTTILYLCTLDLIPLTAIALHFIGNKG